MSFIIRHLDAQSKFCRELSLEAIAKALPAEAIDEVIDQEGVKEQRERKLTMRVVAMLCIAMGLHANLAQAEVMRKLARGLRFIFPDHDYPLPGASAISQRRYQLGARPMVALFRAICRPMTTPDTPGAFLFGLRLMAIDGTVEDVADTPENVAVFGRLGGSRGPSAFPKVGGVYLVEVGSHAIVDAGYWPCHTSERVGGHRLLRSVGKGMLLALDRGFYSYDMVDGARKQGAHVLARMPSYVKPRFIGRLPDGSYLAYIYPGDDKRRKRGEHMLVRIIEYRVAGPKESAKEETYRLVTTFLDWESAPAIELAQAYHERWEIEVVIDEVDTHQRLVGRTLRSLKPAGVIQELYGLLIAHYIVRFLMHAAAVKEGVDPDRLSFTHALEVIRDAVPEFQMANPDQRQELYDRMLRDIARGRVQKRRCRSNPRQVKRKMSNFGHKSPPAPDAPRPRRGRPKRWPPSLEPRATERVTVI